ncbi:MAG: hypothetical protein ACQEQF_05920 [Bacillota bacterium]
MEEVTKVEVGKELPFQNLKLPNDGAILEFSDKSNSFLFVVGFTNMKEKEVENLREGNIEFRYIEDKNFMLPLIKLGNNIFEWVFDPFLYPNGEEKLEQIKEFNLVNLIGYDRRNRIVKVLRSFSIDQKLRQKWINRMNAMKDLNQRKVRFNSFINSIYSYGGVEKLWDAAEKI